MSFLEVWLGGVKSENGDEVVLKGGMTCSEELFKEDVSLVSHIVISGNDEGVFCFKVLKVF